MRKGEKNVEERKKTLRHIILKLLKSKDRKKSRKQPVRGKKDTIHRGTKIRIKAVFLLETKPEDNGVISFKVL